MSDENDNPNENENVDQDAMADEWAAAMEEQGDTVDDIDPDALLAEAGGADQGAAEPSPEPLNVQPQQLDDFSNDQPAEGPSVAPDLETVLDIPVNISMEVGSTEISIRNLLQLNQGSVIELDRFAGEPLDVLVNGTLIAHGEVVVVNEKFGIRMTDVISQSERINKLK